MPETKTRMNMGAHIPEAAPKKLYKTCKPLDLNLDPLSQEAIS